jgi:hypothetical protein
MAVRFSEDDVWYVEAIRPLQLQPIQRGAEGPIVLPPGPYELFKAQFDDGRPEPLWRVLRDHDRNYGTPEKRLMALDRAGSVELTDKDGKALFNAKAS